MYGIKNCDTIKKARHWLEAHQVAYQFHDYRVDGLEHAQLTAFIRLVGDWQPLINTRGTIWRQLDDAQRAAVTDAESACALLGFNAESYHAFTAEKE